MKGGKTSHLLLLNVDFFMLSKYKHMDTLLCILVQSQTECLHKTDVIIN